MDDRYITFIVKLCQLTKDRKINWGYLEYEKSLCSKMDWKVDNMDNLFSALDDSPYTKHFNGDDSFVSQIDETYVALIVGSNEILPTLYVIPSTYRKYKYFEPDDYGEHITRLHNLVKKQFPSADAFIDNLINN